MTDDTNVDAVVADEVVAETAPVAEVTEAPVAEEVVAEEAPEAEVAA
jgi:hypothetical protein